MRTTVIQSLQQALKQAGEQQLRPARARSLELAVQSGLPAELIEFYRENEPQSDDFIGCVGLGSDQPDEPERILFTLARTLEDTFYEPPGSALFPLGYVTFAGTGSGDVYCLDTNVTTSSGGHPVTLFALETIHEDTDPGYIHESRLVVADSLEDFLVKFVDGSLEDMPLYPERSRSLA